MIIYLVIMLVINDSQEGCIGTCYQVIRRLTSEYRSFEPY